MEHETTTALNSCENDTVLIEPIKETTSQINLGSEGKEQYFLIEQSEHEQQGTEVVNTEIICSVEDIEERPLWSNICRICANVNDHLIPIFHGEGVEHALCSKIHKYLPIHITENDNLPLQLCYHCAATLLAWHDLVEGCLEAERRLMDMQTIPSEKQQLYTETENKDDMSAKTSQDLDRCKRNISRVPMIDFKSFQIASQIFLHDHVFRMKSESVVTKPYVSILEHADSVNNDVRDGNIQINYESSKRYLTQETSINNSAAECKESSSSNEVSSNLALNKCALRSRAFRNKKYSDRRPQDIHRKKSSSKESDTSVAPVKSENVKSTDSRHATPITCRICGKMFPLQKGYRTHMRIHTEEKSFTCHVCGKQFGQKGSLYYHLKHVHEGVKNHACDICGRSFAMKNAMEDHRRIHTGERPYVCDSCGKTFKTKASLYIHSKTHTNEYPHKCTYCSKAFRWRQQMLEHLTIHTGEKKFTCDTCGKGFGVRNCLTRHKRIHSEEKPYTCQQCGVSFAQKRYLKNHERTRHKIND